jgi:hypothetical protein
MTALAIAPKLAEREGFGIASAVIDRPCRRSYGNRQHFRRSADRGAVGRAKLAAIVRSLERS